MPRAARMVANNENADYINYSYHTKNSYLSFAGNMMEDCLYCNLAQESRSCVDTDYALGSELCYECVGIQQCYACQYVVDSQNCHSSQFLKDCSDCSDCFLCCNMKHKSHCFMNTQYSKEEYEQKAKEFRQRPLDEQKAFFEQYVRGFPRRCNYNYNSEGCVGEYITKSKNCVDCYQMYEGENCRDVHTGFPGLRDSLRSCYVGERAELVYESLASGADCQRLRWCIVVVSKSSDVDYSEFCLSSTNLFGCSGVKVKQYCIFNTQHSKDEYAVLREKIIEHMKKTGEWGLSFDPRISPFGYNETVAMDFYPLSKEAALAQGYNWQDDIPVTTGKETISWGDIPNDIQAVDESICKEILACEKTGKNYKIIKQELAFYKRFNLPLPRLHPEERHRQRMNHRNAFEFYHRQCMCDRQGHDHGSRCPIEFETTYAPDRPEKIYCEGCYQKEIV
ncbi:hypothetical protein HY623_02930 [Candidatus Uhrbacteria bacterium]|nr:hypothetical protein [Candidatus Uhrbacteria bacterium]